MMATDDGKRLYPYAALLTGAALAVALVAALTVRAAQLGGGTWLPVLPPFVLVLVVPLTTLVSMYHRGSGRQPQTSVTRHPDSPSEPEPRGGAAPRVTRKAA